MAQRMVSLQVLSKGGLLMVSIEETIFTRKRWVLKKMLAFGFQQVGDDYVLERRFLNGDFEAILTVTE